MMRARDENWRSTEKGPAQAGPTTKDACSC
jgi:hypothetical protein